MSLMKILGNNMGNDTGQNTRVQRPSRKRPALRALLVLLVPMLLAFSTIGTLRPDLIRAASPVSPSPDNTAAATKQGISEEQEQEQEPIVPALSAPSNPSNPNIPNNPNNPNIPNIPNIAPPTNIHIVSLDSTLHVTWTPS